MAGRKARKENEAGKAKAGAKSTQAGKKPKAQPVAKSAKAEIFRHIKVRLSATSAVYATAVFEYLTTEALELAGSVSKNMELKRIGPRQSKLSIRGDDELDRLIQANIPIPQFLIVKKKEDKPSKK